LVGEVPEVLLDQRPVFLGVLLSLRLLQRRSVTIGEPGERGTSGDTLARTVRAAGPIPIAFAVSLRAGLALAAALGIRLGLTLSFALPFTFTFSLSLPLALAFLIHGGLRADSRLGQGEGSLGLSQSLCGGGGAQLSRRVLPAGGLGATLRSRTLGRLERGLGSGGHLSERA
jgi:hypothetical protein